MALIRLLVVIAALAAAGGRARANETSEYWAGSFYRAPGGTATVQLPDYDVRNWSAQLYDWNGARVLVLYKGTAKSFRAKATFLFYPEAETKPKELVKSLLERTMKSAPYLEQTAFPREVELAAGKGATAAAGGVDKNGVKIEVTIIAAAEGKTAVAAMFQASEKEMRSQDVQEFATGFVKTLRVGTTVTKPLAPAAPAVAIEGVYEGPDHKYFVFDGRGYVSREAPINDLHLDLPTLSQARAGVVAGYEVNKGVMAASWGETKVSGKIDGEVLTVGEEKYYRVDGKKTLAPRGSYEAQGHTWVFGEGGTVTADGQPYGYRIEGDRMWLDLDGGAVSRPLFPHARSDGTLTEDVLHVGARAYVKVEK